MEMGQLEPLKWLKEDERAEGREKAAGLTGFRLPPYFARFGQRIDTGNNVRIYYK